MHILFSPAVALMNRLRYPAKFLLLGFFVLLAIGLLLASLVGNLSKTLQLTQKEQTAVELLRPLSKQIQLIQQHRGLSAGFLGGNAAMKDKLQAKQVEVEAAVAATTEVQSRVGLQFKTAEEWAGIRQDWDKLLTNGLSLNVPETLAAHGALIERMLRFQVQIADAGGLNGDPDIDTFYLIDTLILQLPEMLERLGKVRAKGTGILSKKDLSSDDKTELFVHQSILQRSLINVRHNLAKVGQARPELTNKLNDFSTTLNAATNGVVTMVNEHILSGTYTVEPQVFFDSATAAINTGYTQLYDTLYPALDEQLQKRVTRLKTHIAFEIGLSVVVCLLLAYLMIGVYLSINATVRTLSDSTRVMAAGDLTVRISLASRDELSLVGDSFNQMVGSFNVLLRKVQHTSEQVSLAAGNLSHSSAKVSASSEEQSSAAAGMAAAVEEMTVSIDQISENAKSAQQNSAQSGNLSSDSARIVENTMHEMESIAEIVNQSAQIIEELGRHSSNISVATRVIKDIADQTNLLALNAAIEAARAGEQGRGFAVVADEVRKLAERTTNSTHEISHMVQAIQSGTENAVMSMKSGVARVAQGVVMSREAGAAIEKVQQGSGMVVESVRDISLSLHEQASTSNDIARNIEHIAQMAEANNSTISLVAETAQQMKRLANELNDEVGRFKVS